MKSPQFTSRRKFISTSAKGILASVSGLALVDGLRAQPHIFKKPMEVKRNIPVMLTAYKRNGKIDYSDMNRLMDFYLESGAKGFFANCLSSEMYHLSPVERIKLTKHVVDHVDGAFPVVASGSFGDSVQEKADFIREMQDTGVDAIILITAHLADKEETDEQLMATTQKIMDNTAGIALGTYECPNPYKRVVTPAVTRFLVDSGRFIYHKDTTEDLQQIRQKLQLSEGSNWGLYNAHIGSAADSLRSGALGLSPIAGNFYPEIISWMCENAERSDKKEDVDWLQEQLILTEKKIGRQYQLGARYFLNKRGLKISPNCRSTDEKLEAEQQKVLDGVLQDLKSWHDRLGIS
jgi:4-hydroxy-tetrahydrodipicolinate synthase